MQMNNKHEEWLLIYKKKEQETKLGQSVKLRGL
jgi:hypothetical protein